MKSGCFRLVCLYLWLGLGAPAVLAASGKIRFETRSHDFGRVVRGQVLKYRFKFKNLGQEPLSIHGVHAACGCTAAEADQGRSYAVDESGYVDVTLDTSDFLGKMSKVVTVMTNESITPDRTLTVRAEVMGEFEADPPLVDFGSVLSKEGAKREVVVKPFGDFSLQVLDLVFPKEIISAQISKTESDGTFLLDVRLKSGLKPGFLKDSIFVKTNSKHLPLLEVPIRGTIRGNIAVAPSYVEFGALGQNEVVRREIVLSGLEDFKVLGTKSELVVNGQSVKDASSFVTIASQDVSASAEKKVAVELKNTFEQGGSVHGKLFVKTSDEGQPEVAVDFYAFFR